MTVEEFGSAILPIVASLVLPVVVLWLRQLKTAYLANGQQPIIEAAIESVIHSIEPGPLKKEEALIQALALTSEALKQYGIKVDPEVLAVRINGAVYRHFNKGK